MVTLDSHDFKELSSIITFFLRQGKIEGTHSLIKTIKFISSTGDHSLNNDANKLLMEVSKELKELLIINRAELDVSKYEKLLEMFRETSILEIDEPIMIVGRSENEEYLSTGEVAKKIGVSQQSVLNMIKDGRIKAEKLSTKHWRIPSSQFKEVDQKIHHLRKVTHQLHSSIGQEVTEEDLEEI
jgi:excisionase family DNA binding protein